MMCPYIRKSYGRVTSIHYNEDGIEDGSIVMETYINEECKREQCGAWYDGMCKYNNT